LVEAVLEVREKSPGWGKDKLVVLLRNAGWSVSTSMVGRILGRLRERGVLVEPPRQSVSVRRRAHPRPYAVRKPKEYVAKLPGDLVQVDTLDLRPVPGIVLKQFTGCDVVSRCNVLSVYSRATSHCASLYLDELEDRSPFPIRAIQVDGGSEFQASFEEECRRRGILLFVLPPHSPKLNGHVERAHRTHQEEFYQVIDPPDTLAELRERLRAQETVYNTIRPHQALGQLTPKEFYQQWLSAQAERG
jgi:transposase InsO family protein